MDGTIDNVKQVTTQWLTNVLTESGHLPVGEVETFSEVESQLEGFTSDRHHLTLKYSEDAPKNAPTNLFLKIGKLDAFKMCNKEVEFYGLAADSDIKLPILESYGSSTDLSTNQSYLLLDDLSTTHFNPDFTVFRANPNSTFTLSREECKEAVKCLAAIHGNWWNNPQLGDTIGERLSEESSNQIVQVLAENIVTVFSLLGDKLPSQRLSVYEAALSSYPKLINEYLDSGALLTLIHGDAHLGNFMFPIKPNEKRVVLLDWQSWRADIGVTDLAHMMALNWHPNQRQKMEQDLLIYYHSQLIKKGVINYSWEECWFGYRLQVIWMLFMPILWHLMKLPLNHCYQSMEKSYSAFQDLECVELLGG